MYRVGNILIYLIKLKYYKQKKIKYCIEYRKKYSKGTISALYRFHTDRIVLIVTNSLHDICFDAKYHKLNNMWSILKH